MAAVTVLATWVGGAAAATPARVAPVDDSTRVALRGNVSPRVQAATDLGPAAADRQLSLALHFTRSAAQDAALTALLADQQNPASPHYHQWLTPDQFGAQFGLAAADAARVTSWLESQGFTVDGLAPGGQSLRFSGSVAQAQAAFGTELHRVQLHGVDHIANLSAPTLPAAIAAVAAGISGLDDLIATPRPHTLSVTPPAAAAGAMHPQFTSPYSGNIYIAPGDVYTIYDESPALTASINGTGVSIAVLAQSNIHLSDIAAFRAASGLPASIPSVKVYGADPGFASSADVSEAEIVTEWAGAAAPGATIAVIDTSSMLNSLISAVTNNVAPVLVDSYPECEADLGASNIALYSGYLAQAAAQGMTVVAATGNAGPAACDTGSPVATNGPAVSFPASSPYVTAVGATEFNDLTGNYWSASNGSNGGSALSYIPELAWNENSTSPLLATGGGSSRYFAKPSWQQGTGIQDEARDVPDVALQASLNFEGHLVCEAGYCVTGFYSLTPSLDIAGGTDIAAPEFAGFLALVVQKQGRIGVANPTLYALANSTYASAVFHDVTSGSNISPCQTGTAGCSTGTLGYNAGTGYDLSTGWGSVDVFNLVNDWSLVSPLVTSPSGTTASITNVAASASKITAGTSVTLTATVASGVSSVTTQPTGSVQFTVDGTPVGALVTLSSGTASYALSTGTLTAGSHLVQASYHGDSTFAGSRGAFTLDVNAATAPDFTLTPATASVTVASGAIANPITFTVMPINGFTGAVTFNATASSSLTATPAFNPTTVQITGTAAQSTTLTLLAYQGLVQTGTSTMAANRPTGWQRAGSGVFFAGVLLLLVPRRRRLTTLMLAVVMLGSLGLTGCFGSGTSRSSGPTRTNTPPGTYSITVTATGLVNGSAVSHSSTVTFVVQ